MAKLKPPIMFQEQPKLTGRIDIRTHKGQVIAQAWPKKRGTPKAEITRTQNDDFLQANWLAKYAAPYLQRMSILLAKDGPWYPRDLIVSSMYGRLWDQIDLNGTVYTSMAARNDVNQDLLLLGKPTAIGQGLIWDGEYWKPGSVGGGGGSAPVRSIASGPTNALGSSGSYRPLQWSVADVDAIGCFSLGSEPTQCLVPAEFDGGLIRFSCAVTAYSFSGEYELDLRKNGTDSVFISSWTNRDTVLGALFNSPLIEVSAGDFYEMWVRPTTNGGSLGGSTTSWHIEAYAPGA